MPTALTHPVVPLAIAIGLGKKMIATPLVLTGMVVSILPDADVLAFRLGIPYAASFGHRGMSHSIFFAALLALLLTSLFRPFRTRPVVTFFYLFIGAVSHGLLDTLTNGGLGITLFWPWSAERYFAPWRVIEVSPLSLERFLLQKSFLILRSEFLWVWTSSMILSVLIFLSRRLSPFNGKAVRPE